MTAPAKFRKADMNRLFSSARQAGYSRIEGEIKPDGSIVFRAVDEQLGRDEEWRNDQPFYRGHK